MIICFDYYTAKYFKCDENRVTEAVNKMNELLKSRKEKGKPVNIIAAGLYFYGILGIPHVCGEYNAIGIENLYHNDHVVDTIRMVPMENDFWERTVYIIEWD